MNIKKKLKTKINNRFGKVNWEWLEFKYNIRRYEAQHGRIKLNLRGYHPWAISNEQTTS
jgi:hypothetical protein